MRNAIDWWERHQIALYIGAILIGAGVGLALPALAHPFELAINPVLGVLLYSTFLGVPLTRVGTAFRDIRFLGAVLLLNFVLIPIVVFALSRFVADNQALLVGVLFVLLTPCVDYVIVFAGLAGGAKERLLAATPLLMLVQILLLPLYLWLMAGPAVVEEFDVRPFVEAFLLLIVLPLTLAAITQLLARQSRAARGIQHGLLSAMVPLMMLTLAVVVASQMSAVIGSLAQLLVVVPIFIAFVLLAAPLGAFAGRLGKLDVPSRRAVIFSGATRNSLVVLPLALALPTGFAITPLVVVTQTLVELIAMVAMVGLVPRLNPHGPPHPD
ncbi:arsenic resistance protein [Microbacterium sp. AZCO]|uniref:arsenic resistance protein n=1 Tax=Microbacterium sp. AZCO TaxID=3142976 RepID=UPI0031F430BB